MPQLDVDLLHKAARLATRGHGCAEPNPLVGCIITNKNGTVVGEGFHEKFGEEHAEVNALAMAGDEARGGTAYVTLEPCNHLGKTPPCSHALLRAGIARVVIGFEDPHIEARGGADYLLSNGIDVEFAHDDVCREIIAPFTHRIQTGLPWITCKWAQTIDGCIETPDGDSPWISCTESQQLVHEERGCVDAIVVGIGTVMSDNPTLTVRNAQKYRTPLRVVIDPTLRISPKANILNDEAPTLVAHAEGTDTSNFNSTQLLALPCVNRTLDLLPLFKYIATAFDATNVLIEGGATLFQHIFLQNLANELWVFTSPETAGFSPKINMNTLVDSLDVTLLNEQRCGRDISQRFVINNCQKLSELIKFDEWG